MGLNTLRKQKIRTQSEFAAKLAQQLRSIQRDESQHTSGTSYLEKRIRKWEKGEERPSDEEIAAVSAVLEVPVEKIKSLLGIELGGHVASSNEFFERLGQRCQESDSEHLLAVVYGGKTGIGANPRYDMQVRSALATEKVWLAVFIPYPPTIHFRAFVESGQTATYDQYLSEVHLPLKDYYQQTRAYAFKRYLGLRSKLPPDLHSRLALFEPNIRLSSVLDVYMPPFNFRQMLHVVKDTPEDVSKELYTWQVPLESVPEIWNTQMIAWSAFFGLVVTNWIESNPASFEASKTPTQPYSYWKMVTSLQEFIP